MTLSHISYMLQKAGLTLSTLFLMSAGLALIGLIAVFIRHDRYLYGKVHSILLSNSPFRMKALVH